MLTFYESPGCSYYYHEPDGQRIDITSERNCFYEMCCAAREAPTAEFCIVPLNSGIETYRWDERQMIYTVSTISGHSDPTFMEELAAL